MAIAGVVADSRVSKFECTPAGVLRQQARFSPFERTQIDVFHFKPHRNRSQSRSEMTDPSEGVNVRVLAFDIRGANATPFDPRSTDGAESGEVILAVFHERQVCDE